MSVRFKQCLFIVVVTYIASCALGPFVLAQSAPDMAVIHVSVTLKGGTHDELRVFADGDTYFVRPAGTTVTFSVYVEGATGNILYAWNRITGDKALVPIEGAYSEQYTLQPIVKEDEGKYVCVVVDEGSNQTAWSPEFELVVMESVPASDVFYLTLLSGILALLGVMGAFRFRKQPLYGAKQHSGIGQ